MRERFLNPKWIKRMNLKFALIQIAQLGKFYISLISLPYNHRKIFRLIVSHDYNILHQAKKLRIGKNVL